MKDETKIISDSVKQSESMNTPRILAIVLVGAFLLAISYGVFFAPGQQAGSVHSVEAYYSDSTITSKEMTTVDSVPNDVSDGTSITVYQEGDHLVYSNDDKHKMLYHVTIAKSLDDKNQ